MSVARSPRATWGILSGALALGCGGGGSGGPGPTAPPEVASVRLFVGVQDVTDHIALLLGQTLRIEVRLYAANGGRIAAGDGEFDVQFGFSPSSVATAAAVPSSPLERDVTATAPAGTHGTLMVACDDHRLMSLKQFGPFEILVH